MYEFVQPLLWAFPLSAKQDMPLFGQHIAIGSIYIYAYRHVCVISLPLSCFFDLGAAIFDMEYSRWLEDDQRHMSELRTGLNAHLSDSDLRIIVDSYISHYDEIFRLKVAAVKADVFHLITGMWATTAERCFLWMGGFRPSDLIKVWTQPLIH